MNLNPEDVLVDFQEQMKKPDNIIKMVFVPEPIVDDLKAQGHAAESLLYYDKAVTILGSNALKELVYLNSLSNMSPEETKDYYDSVLMSEQLTPLLGEALDIRQFWLEQVDNKEDFFNQFFSNNQYKYDVQQVLKKVVNGISSQLTFINNMYESICTTPSGRYYFITVPYSTVECEISANTLDVFKKKVFESVLRKSSIYHPDKIISASSVFGTYLLDQF